MSEDVARVAGVSTVERDGTVGGDGAYESWSVRVTFEGEDPTDPESGWTTYAYPVDLAERAGLDREDPEDAALLAEQLGDFTWDVEEMTMSERDVTYSSESLTGFRTFEEADAYARHAAEADRAYYLTLVGTEVAR